MDKSKNKNISKFDKIKKNFLIVSCVILSSVFLASVAYMLTLINNTQTEKQYVNNNNNKTVQNMNLVNM